MSHAPIETKHQEKMRELAKLLDDYFKPCGFALLVFDQNTTDGRMNYISNSNRKDMLIAMKEFIANHEGRVPEFNDTKQ